MDIKKLSESLHPLERRVVPFLKEGVGVDELADSTKLSGIEVMRAVQWLENKDVLKIDTEIKELITLDENGVKYLKSGLPEFRFLETVKGDSLSLNDIRKKNGLDSNEISICIGTLKSKAAIEMDKGIVRITPAGKTLLEKRSLEEKFLKKKFPLDLADLESEERFALENLRKRKSIVKIDSIKIQTVSPTKIGLLLCKEKIDDNTVDKLTPSLIRSGKWKDTKFRRYDVRINVPNINGGKRHFVDQAINYAKRVWIDMGFEEMEGPILNTSFWNFDALFTAQDHPVRELQDTFYIKNPSKGNLPKKEVVDRVRNTHEKGVDGSLGWRYKWDPEEAKKNVLRTHTTILSALTLYRIKKSDLPAKFFSVGKCFRNETLDWSHHFEFNQTDGIVIDPNANFRHLFGYLKEFYKKMGYPKARFRPAHFPYTEPSLEIDIFHPEKKEWVELGGAGMFRPEVVIPLFGEYVPVLAWGPGFDRILMEYYEINDLRLMYNNDIKHLRGIKAWMR